MHNLWFLERIRCGITGGCARGFAASLTPVSYGNKSQGGAAMRPPFDKLRYSLLQYRVRSPFRPFALVRLRRKPVDVFLLSALSGHCRTCTV